MLADVHSVKGTSQNSTMVSGCPCFVSWLRIETGKIQQPSPNVLHALADIYSIDYTQLMEMAGYITHTKPRKQHQRHGRVPTFAEHHLTAEEESD
jgi:HTH-type transcriptional regulator, competence development regulator